MNILIEPIWNRKKGFNVLYYLPYNAAIVNTAVTSFKVIDALV